VPFDKRGAFWLQSTFIRRCLLLGGYTKTQLLVAWRQIQQTASSHLPPTKGPVLAGSGKPPIAAKRRIYELHHPRFRWRKRKETASLHSGPALSLTPLHQRREILPVAIIQGNPLLSSNLVSGAGTSAARGGVGVGWGLAGGR
jgi:hypothetical protein